MTTVSRQTAAQPAMLRIITSAPLRFLALAALCSAYIQGPLVKIVDFPSAIAEMNHFGLSPAPVFAIIVIIFELTMSALVLSGIYRWAAAFALSGFTIMATLLALRFWVLPPGMERSMAMNGFFEHLGLAGAFIFVALVDIASRHPVKTKV
ncbi:DoxX family protein (plasmid) [Rhizobium sp. T136]|uniref:Membrane protein n=2 Tax=Rhizobium/Agrobacterium group TaxID=227290 RepID=W6RN92_9HYPH|nr:MULTISPECIES: DoxX family protein [Rhizobium]UFS79058.1 DoxX family protein [Rhizobium sp. T136]CDM62552.1 putative membrane protein [Rhizobium favelukesii]